MLHQLSLFLKLLLSVKIPLECNILQDLSEVIIYSEKQDGKIGELDLNGI